VRAVGSHPSRVRAFSPCSQGGGVGGASNREPLPGDNPSSGAFTRSRSLGVGMSNLAALLIFTLIPPTIWWVYGPQRLALAARTGIRFLFPVLFGALGGVVAGLVSVATGASGNILICIALATTALAGIPVAHGLRTRRGEALGAPEGASAPRTEVDHLWVPPLGRNFHCAECGYQTEEADRPWSLLRTTGACPRCRTPAFLASP
jgi:hypothetical protein